MWVQCGLDCEMGEVMGYEVRRMLRVLLPGQRAVTAGAAHVGRAVRRCLRDFDPQKQRFRFPLTLCNARLNRNEVLCAARFCWCLTIPFASQSATDDSIRGFDPAAQTQEVKWEQQARAIPDAGARRRIHQALYGEPAAYGGHSAIVKQTTLEGILAQLKGFPLALTPTSNSVWKRCCRRR